MSTTDNPLQSARERVAQELQKQKDLLSNLELLPVEYREKASTALQQQFDKAKQLAEDTRSRISASDAGRQLAELEVRVLKATAETAKLVTGLIERYENEIQDRIKMLETRLSGEASAEAKAIVEKETVAPTAKPAAKAKVEPKAKAAPKTKTEPKAKAEPKAKTAPKPKAAPKAKAAPKKDA